MSIKHVDKINLKAQITRGYDIKLKPYDENNLIGIFDGEVITLDDKQNHITKFHSHLSRFKWNVQQ